MATETPTVTLQGYPWRGATYGPAVDLGPLEDVTPERIGRMATTLGAACWRLIAIGPWEHYPLEDLERMGREATAYTHGVRLSTRASASLPWATHA